MPRRNLYLLTMLATLAWPGLAPVIAHGAAVTACGPTICYEYDDAQAGVALFGLPTLVADSLRFLPGEFRAVSTNGAFDLASATFVIDRVYSAAGLPPGEVTVTELGDHRIWGDGSFTADRYRLASDNGTGESAAPVIAAFEAAGASGLAAWSLGASLAPASLFDGAAGDIALVIQNTLAALGNPALIQKKALTVGVSAVPIPATAWLLAPGLALLANMARRRRMNAR